MRVLGIDFTSAPRRSKPITCLQCTFTDGVLRADELDGWSGFENFEGALHAPGVWIAGIDFPFGQSRTFIESIGWPLSWQGYVAHARSLGRGGFREALNDYRIHRPAGHKEHKRKTDKAAGSVSPQKLYGVPVGLMFFEGAPRLLDAGVTIPHLQVGDPRKVVVEAYPGVLARQLIGRHSYKSDSRTRQSEERHVARREMLEKILNGDLESTLGFRIIAPATLADDPKGDRVDALLCAMQAAWAWSRRGERYGAPETVDSLEGWIADPTLAAV
jgi:hypothetical protein